jgi:signal transduction histidine kinase
MDAGPGIPEDQLERVLESFEQSGASQAHAQAESNLGVALVELHGGTIHLESEVDREEPRRSSDSHADRPHGRDPPALTARLGVRTSAG